MNISKNMLFKYNIINSMKYLKRNALTVIVVLLIYITGFIYGMNYPGGSNGNKVSLSFRDITLFDIFFNNIQVAFTMIAGGILFFGIGTIVLLFFNGYILGSAVYYTYNVDPNLINYALLPHGIIEIPTFLLAGFVGLRFPFEFYKYLIEETSNLKKNLIELFNISFCILILLLIAALIESSLVPFIFNQGYIDIGGM